MSNINHEALKVMNTFIEDGEVVISSVSLADVLGVRHNTLLISIERTIRNLEEALASTSVMYLAKEYIRRCKYILKSKPFSTNDVDRYYLLNREFASELLVKYDFYTRVSVLDVFWKFTDGLKEAGYNHTNIEELSDNVDDAIGKLKKLAEESYMTDWNEVDLDDDNPLFEYEPYQYAIALIREIVKKHDLAKIINLVIDAGQMDDKLCDMFIALYEFGVSGQNKVEIDLSKFKKNK